jgi:putative FmdB family regulatory protein
MPIYAYRCSSCGDTRDLLRKISDAPLTTCPACHAETYTKQVTAAGFQLKGSGWYVTDFKGGKNGSSAPAVSGAAPADGGAKPSGDGGGGSAPAGGDAGGGGASSGGSTAGSTGGGTTAAASCGGSCACH